MYMDYSLSLLCYVTIFTSITHHAASQCGVQSSITKIVGGEDVPTLKYPWYVALVSSDSSSSTLQVSCGGSLITSRHVLTAAHCFPKEAGRPERLYRAVFGLVNRCQQERQGVDSVALLRVDLYPSFNTRTLQGDIAVATLERAVQYTPICLPARQSALPREAQIIGFGSTMAKAQSQYPCVLQEARIAVFTRRQCERSALAPEFSRLPGIICAGLLRGGVDSCDGDSGGPLQSQGSSGAYTVQGIVSFGEGCARRNLPGVYTMVSSYRDFIDGVIASSGRVPDSSSSISQVSSSRPQLTQIQQILHDIFGNRRRFGPVHSQALAFSHP